MDLSENYKQNGYEIVLENNNSTEQEEYTETVLPFANEKTSDDENFVNNNSNRILNLKNKANDSIPQRIRDMLELYEFKNGFRKNFYIQGKFMEDYEDDKPWNGNFLHYFPTYNDLDLEQLRGYFTWRTQVRRGEYLPISTSLAYIYVYELLDGIGTVSVEDSLEKLKEFEKEFIDSGIGDVNMKSNVRRWMMELAVASGFPPDVVRQYTDPKILAFDEALLALKKPNEHSDDEIFNAFVKFGGKKITLSPVLQNNESEGKRLFARIWKYTLENFNKNGRRIFALCFGGFRYYDWYPMGNAVYYREKEPDSLICELNECHKYVCKKGIWKEQCYYEEFFNKKRFKGLLHEADRLLRIYLNIGRPLKEIYDEAWATPFIQAVIEADKQEKLEALKPKINICFDNLEQIRQNAIITRDSLLTEEEKFEETKKEEVKVAEPVILVVSNESVSLPLDNDQVQILKMIFKGESVKQTLKSLNKMAEVVADSLNEILFDEIGDNAVECIGDDIVLIDDYIEDIERIIGGKGEN